MNQKKAYTHIAIGFALGFGLSTLVFTLLLLPAGPPAQDGGRPPSTKMVQSKLVEDMGQERADKIMGNCRIMGTVSTPDGEPLPDAFVRLRLLDEPWSTSEIDLVIRTNKEGSFSQAGLSNTARFGIWAHAPGYAITSSEEVHCEASIDLTLDPGIELALSFEANNDDISKLSFILGGDNLWPPRRGTTDDKGQIVISGLAPGQYEIWAFNDSHAFITLEPFVLEKTGRQEQTFKLKTSRTQRIEVTAAKGGALRGTPMILKPTPGSLLSRQVTTDQNGRVNVEGITPDLSEITLNTIGVFAPAYVSITAGDVATASFDTGIVLKGKIQTSGGMPIPGVDIDVSEILGPQVATLLGSTKGGFLGRLLAASTDGWPQMLGPDESGGHIPGPLRIALPNISVSSGGRADSSTVTRPWQPTDNNGRFVLSGLPEGRIRLEAMHRDYVARNAVELRIYEDLPPEELTIEMRRGSTATIRATDEHGKSLEDIEILVYDSFEQIVASAHTNSEGIAELRGLPGACRVIATSPQRVPAYRDIQERIGRHIEVQLLLPEASLEIVGQVLNKEGNGVPGAFITARSITKGLLHSLAGTTENDGTFVLKNAGSGSYRIIADAGEKGRAQIGDITSTEEVKLVLGSGDNYSPPSGTLNSNIVLDPNTWTDNLGTTNSGTTTTGVSTATEFGEAQQLVVTAKPSGRGGVPITIAAKGGGVVVTSITPGSRAADAGIKKGDRIVAIDGRDVKGPANARKSLLGTIGTVVMLEIQSKSGERFTAIVQREHIPR